jgi:hypothetical protein
LKPSEIPLKDPAPTKDKSAFGAKLAAATGHSVVIVRPQGYLLEQTNAKARQCKDAESKPSHPRRSRASRASPRWLRRRESSARPYRSGPPICCRDKNLIVMQATFWVRVWASTNPFITGYPPKLGDYPSLAGLRHGLQRLAKVAAA